ncbi:MULTISPECIES: gluconeogenesis factor YvcK family protein [Bacillus]|uniref:gluconeogenesis factor YvcK family protein n=1 Tax=Bacillus TaxID=1386 RepID=UPI0009CAB318|nr:MULTISPECIES: YvcK family protein [Bacillus]MBL3627036.1 YvcK family protein [Bacillus sp. RHF6]MEC1898283.1 YvcK family protein [Bacillus velezensis]MEC1916648.1 YvcK family protein [Bacillus velezensis]SLC34850.1 LPPG:FO 2-phospho-L-lactate transferase [Mycobacteroides abscessus subsp. massiliense]
MNKKPKIAIFGGGTGLSVLLRGLKHKPVDITAIVTVADDGGSSGRLRDELQIPPPGDIRNVLAALSDVEPLVENLFQHRFNKGSDLTGHSLGNLILAAMTNITGDFFHAVTEMSKVLNVRGRVLPAANTSVVLHAEMEDGQVVSGESTIPSYGQRIKRVFLTPEKIDPLPETIDVIRQTDLIIIGPGSLYTSILPNLLVPKIGEEVVKAAAKKVYICNVMTQPGETLQYSAADHVKALNDHMEQPFIDTILINNEEIPDEIKSKYAKELARPVDFNIEKLKSMGLEVIRDQIITYKNGVIRHDTHKVASLLVDLLRD